MYGIIVALFFFWWHYMMFLLLSAEEGMLFNPADHKKDWVILVQNVFVGFKAVLSW